MDQQLAAALQRLQTMQAAVQQLQQASDTGSRQSRPTPQTQLFKTPQDAYVEYQRQTSAVPPEMIMPTKRERAVAFRRHDDGSKGSLTLAEVDRAVKDIWPEHDFGHKQQIILSAYYAADEVGDGWISRKRFKALLEHLIFFQAEWQHFEAIDVDEHNQITIDGFKTAAQGLHMGLSEDDEIYIFDQLDEEGYGFVDFDTFCSWAARRDLEVSRAADEGVANSHGEQDRGWEAGNAHDASTSLSAVLYDSYGAADESSWGTDDAANSSSLEAALAAAEMSAPSWNAYSPSEKLHQVPIPEPQPAATSVDASGVGDGGQGTEMAKTWSDM